MIEVTVGTTTENIQKHYSPSKTIREILEENNINYSHTSILVDSVSLQHGEIDMTLAALGKVETCFIIAAVKAESA